MWTFFLLTDQPRSLLDTPNTTNITNSSSSVTWANPGGVVDAYIIRLTQNVPPHLVSNVSVHANITTITLDGLEPGTSYSVEVFSMNQNGISLAPSPFAQFDTLRKSLNQ